MATAISACIIACNEADRIRACLEALAFCDEIVLVDSHSTDATREIAASCGARVIERDWPGYRSQKQFATDAAHNDWVLCVDADEVVTPALRAQIAKALSRPARWGTSAGQCRDSTVIIVLSLIQDMPSRV